jgi:hypothetical protein
MGFEKLEEITKDDPRFQDKLKEVRDRYFGLAGDPESESFLSTSKVELKEGYCTFFSSTKDITRFCDRLPDAILSITDYGHAVSLKLCRTRFRGFSYAFKKDRNAENELGDTENG